MRYALSTSKSDRMTRGISRLALVIAIVVGATPSAPVVAALPAIPTGCWKLTVTPDAAAAAAGRDKFDEYVTFETSNVTAQEMSRLGFSPSGGTASVNAAGQITFTVTLTSGCYGTATWSGTFGTNFVSGTLKWVKDGQTYNYSYTGGPYTPPVDVES